MDISQQSDGFHTFDELYEHRHLLFCLMLQQKKPGSFKSWLHHDGSSYKGWFIAGCLLDGKQITYHLPERYWDLCPAPVLETSPEWDGHTSQDVIQRMKDYLGSKP